MSGMRADLVGDHDGHAGVRAEDGAHGVHPLHVARQELGAAAVGQVDALAHHKRPGQELQTCRKRSRSDQMRLCTLYWCRLLYCIALVILAKMAGVFKADAGNAVGGGCGRCWDRQGCPSIAVRDSKATMH